MAPQSISQSINIDENHQEADTEYVRQKCRRFGQWMANAPPGDEVVITGISGRFPESNSVHELRDNLFNKKDMVTGDFRRFRSCSSEIPQRGGRLISLDKFDAGYFGVHQRQAMNMDPGYRITLEVVVEAIMDAGINPSELEGTRTGVLLSICLSDFENVYKCDPKLLPQQFGITGLVRSGAMHRISYALKLKGPSYLVDTACSSTLYALENAYGMIRRGMCENVLVPGIQLIFHPGSTLQFSRLGVLSPDGKCRSFDNEARGYVRSEAISCVLVQKAKNARRIYAKVVHAKVNDDGLKDRGITFPSTDMQSKLMDEFYQECGVSVDDLSYFEAHGTGTPVGDPEELNAIDRTIARKRRSPLLIGSVKSNLGHAEGGSALCSVIKVILAMETNIISPNINFKTMIKGVEGLESGRLKVVTERTRIPTEDITIGINSFGFGGSNCHVLLRSFGKTKVNHGLPLDDIPRILCVSGRSEEAVHSIFDDIGSRRLDAEFVRLIQEVYSRDFPNHFYRGYVILSRGGEIKRSCKWNAVKRPLLLIFGEFLTTFHVIGASLLELLPFKESLDRMQEILRCRKLDVKELITKKPSNLFEMVLGSIVVQLAMGDVLKLLNIITDLTFAQSLGEFALAYYRGTVTLEKVLSTVYDIGISVQRNTTGNSKGHQEENELRKKVYELVQEPKNRSILNLSVENKEATQSHCFRDTLMNLDSLKRSFHRKYVIIEVGDGKLSKVLEDNMRKQVIEKFYMCDDTNTLLNIIGNLFQYGHVPQIHKLYSEVEFPVSRKTPMLAPLIKWLHTKSWTVYRYPDPEIIDKNTVERYDIDSKHVDWGYVSGHVIDGRNLFPAIGYLHLVWRCISTESFHVPTSVVFENCKFIRAATVPTEGKLQLVVRYQHGTGNFESVNPLWGSWNPVYLTTLANTYLEEEQMGCKLTIRSHNWRRKMSDRRLDFLRDDLWRIDWSNIWCSCGSVDSNPDMSVFFAGIMTQKLIKLANPKGVIKSENGKVILTPKELDQKIEFQTAVLENDACLVTGRVKKPEEVNNVITVPPEPSVKRSSMPMKTRDIYKELRLRGYHYKGLFTGLEEYDCTTSSGLIKWNTNWVSFMDNMLQACILERDTRLLYIPVSIKRLAIDTEFHENYALNFGENPLLPVYVNKQSNSIKSGGVEICGLTANTIPRRKSPADPVLEKYVFVPNKVSLSASESVRVNMQLILENAMTNTVNAVEIVDESTNLNPVLLAPLINDALQDLPLIKPSIIVSSTVPLSVEDNVRVENRSIKSGDEYLLIVGSNMLQRRTKLDGALLALKCDGYILSREEQSYEPQDTPGIEVLTVHTTKSEKLVLCTKSRKSDISTCVHVCSKDFSWLSELKDSVKHNGTVIVYSQDDLNGVMGLVNCIRREPAGGNKFKCFLVVDSAPKFSVKDRFYQEQLKKNLCINVFKNGQWGTYRHLLIEDLDQVNCEHSFVNFTTRGDLSSLKWFEGPISCSGTVNENELLVHVYYASLNFKDVMIASGRITVDSIIQNGRERECIQGFEYTGKDTSGRRVMGMVNDGALATLLLVDPNLMWEVPETWTLEEAATVPVVYATVIYSLIMRSHLRPGQSILIHSGTGGIGLAAINVALFYSCNIFVTVGTEEKRKFLNNAFPQIRDDQIGNSRDLSFEQMIKRKTNGRGVDFVLNSLAEDKLRASVRCLARGGLFLEIGKYDLVMNNSLELLSLKLEASYCGIMLDQLFKETIEKKLELQEYLSDGIAKGYVKPLPRTIFKKTEVETAFRYMASGKHMGKVLISIREEEISKLIMPSKTFTKAIPRFFCDRKKTYIILGGLGGFGLELADWLVLRGAKYLVLTSRKGIQTGYQFSRVSKWRSYGVFVHISTTDTTTKEGCLQLLKEASTLAPVDGIFNLAVVLRDAVLENQTEKGFEVSFAPKAWTTRHLDELTRKMCPNLSHFVIFSSVSCGRGNAGQSNYGMANSIMEGICEQRKKDGLPALAIQWGAIGEVGLVAEMQTDNKELEIGGTLQQRIFSCLEVMDKLMKQKDAVVSSMVVAEKRQSLSSSNNIVESVANILGITNMKTVSMHGKLSDLGVDSITTVEVMQLLERDFQISLNAQEVRSLTLAKLQELQTPSESVPETKSVSKKVSPENQEYLEQIFTQYFQNESSGNEIFIKLPSKVDQSAKAPVAFFIAGIEGSFNALEHLARNLEVHAFGLQYHYYNPGRTIREIAEMFLPNVIRVLSNKTFTLVPYSYGVLVGIELAALLEKMGYTGRIIAIDGSIETIKDYFSENANHKSSESEWETNIFSYIGGHVIPVQDILAECKEKLEKCNTLEDRAAIFLSFLPQQTSNIEIRSICNMIKRIKAIDSFEYTHKRLKSGMTLYKPTLACFHHKAPDYNLSNICSKPVDFLEFEGSHSSILQNNDLISTLNKTLLASSSNEMFLLNGH